MSYEYSPSVPTPSVQELRRENFRKHLVYPLIGATALGVMIGAGSAINTGKNTLTTVGEAQVGIDHTPTDSVREAAAILAEQADISEASIRGIHEAALDVASELSTASGRAVQRGEQIDVTLVQNSFGEYSVMADPANTGDFSK